MQNPEFRLTGKHVLASLIAFFVVIMGANAIFLTYAIKTFPGEREEKSYLQGLNYNDRLAARAEQGTLGWRASVDQARLDDSTLTLRVSVMTVDDIPLPDLALTGSLSRPASDAHDVALVFANRGGGTYEVEAPAGTGAWDLSAIAERKGPGKNRAERFVFGSRLILE